jgi:hypothetical protein
MSAGVYKINLDKSPIYECGATLLALLAYPQDDEEDSHRASLHASLCAWGLRYQCKMDENEITPVPMKPVHAFRSEREIAKDLRTLGRRLRDRMVAARMVVPFLQEVELGKKPKLPKSIKRLSLNEMAVFVAEEAEQSEPQNVESRVWRPSLRVIHLAVAALIIGADHVRAGGTTAMETFLISEVFIKAVVKEAEVNEERIAKATRLPLNTANLIRVRLA